MDYKREESATLRMKVLRSVLAVGVGFAMTPWLGRGAYAADPASIDKGTIYRAGSTTNLISSGTAHIYADKAANGVGLNAFDRFTVGNNELANLYFKQENSNVDLHTLVNTVNDRISIYGTVNAIRNNKVGGNLYFLSPQGMVVGAKGAINAGSLTVMTSGMGFSSAEAAAQAITDKNWGGLDSKSSIDIHGKINTATGIDLRAAYINVTKTGTDAPLLKTGAMFSTVVSDNKVTSASVEHGRLTASVDNDGNIVIADPNDESDVKLKGDGSIKLAAYSDSLNAKTAFLVDNPPTDNTVQAKVTVGDGATIDARGNVAITAEAVKTQSDYFTNFWNISMYSDADVTVNGSVTGADININSTATTEHTSQNMANALQLINELTGMAGVDLNSKLSGFLWGKMEEAGNVYESVQLGNNILNQLYMPFALSNAKATTTIGSNATVTANKLKNGDTDVTYNKDGKAQTVGGNMDIGATSSATNSMKIAIQPRLKQGTSDLSKYFVGGFIYGETTSNATVNVDGILESAKDMSIYAKATGKNKNKLSVKSPKFYDDPAGGGGDKYAPLFTVGVGLAYQDTNATVNLGSASNATSNTRIKAGGKLKVNSTTKNTMSSEVSVSTKDDTALSTVVNIVGSKGNAYVNDYVGVQGKSVNIQTDNSMAELTVSTDNEYNGEYTGLDWLLDQDKVKEKADSLKPLLQAIGLGNQQNQGGGAAGGGGGGGGANVTSWNQYFDIGASVAVANITNNALTKIYAPASIKATSGNVNIGAAVTIDDTYFNTTTLLVNSKKTTNYSVSAAVAVENMNNKAEVEVVAENNNKAQIEASGDASIAANTDQRYNRVDSMIEDLKDAWESFKKHYTDWSAAGRKDKLNKLENIIVDIFTLRKKETTDSYKDSKNFASKANAAIDLLTSLTGTGDLKDALLTFTDASNYVNMYTSAAFKNDGEKAKNDVTAILTGAVSVQNLHNTANVKIGANTVIKAGDYDKVSLSAEVVESNVLGSGKWAFLPDVQTTADAKTGLGGTVGIQNAYNNSKVQIMNGVSISAGSIDIATKNDVVNIGLVLGGSATSKLGITGMVSYMGGESHAETLVDDDVNFNARKKVKRQKKEGSETEYEDAVISDGAVNISSTNDTDIVSVVGDLSSTTASALGVSTGVINYDIHSLAKVENQELNADGSSAETNVTAGQKGIIYANSVNVNALTDGVINNFTIAGTKSKGTTNNANQAGGGVNAAAAGGQGVGGVQNANINANGGGNQQDPTVKVAAAGSVSWNYVVDETRATVDNVIINLTNPSFEGDVVDRNVTTSVNITSEDKSYIGAYSGSMALAKLGSSNTNKFQGSLVGAIAVNDLNKDTYATLSNSSVINADNVYNLAQNTGAQVAAGLSLGVETGKRANDTVDVNLAASVSANYIDSDVHANMLQNDLQGKANDSMTVNNVAYDKDVQVAGGITLQYVQSTAAAGAAITINKVNNDISAHMNGNSIGSAQYFAHKVENLALSNLTQVGTAISGGLMTGSGYVMADVAVSNNYVTNNVKATLDGDNSSTQSEEKIYAVSVAVEARDGKLKDDTSGNSYLKSLNTVTNPMDAQNTITVDTEGNYYQNGQMLQYAFAVGEGDNKQYVIFHINADGDYEDINHNVLIRNSEGDCYYVDGPKVDITDVKYYNNGQEVNVAAPVVTQEKEIFDLDGSDIMKYANGSNGFDIDVEENGDGLATDNTYKSKTVSISNEGNVIVGAAIGLVGKTSGESGSATAAAAVNINKVDNDFTAELKNANIISSNTTTEPGVLVQAKSKTNMVAVAAGVAVATSGDDKFNITASGSGVKNEIDNDTTALVQNSTVATNQLKVAADTAAKLIGVSGQVSAEIGQKGIAAGMTWAENKLDNTTGAYVRGLELNGYNNGNTSLIVDSQNNSRTWAVAVGAGVATGYGAAEGAVAKTTGKNNTEAVVEKYEEKDDQGQTSSSRVNVIRNVNSITVNAKDTTIEKTVAGSIGVAAGSNAMASLGGSVAYTDIGKSSTDRQKVKAELNDATITTVAAAPVKVEAHNTAKTLNLALGGAVRANTDSKPGISLEGSVSKVTVYSDTVANIHNTNISAVNASGSKSKVSLLADSDTEITSSADAMSVSVSDSVSLAGGAAVSVIKSDADTTADVNGGNWNVDEAIIKAKSVNKITDVAIGLGVGLSNNVAGTLTGNIASNKITNDTSSFVTDATIVAQSNLGVLVDSEETLKNYGGALSVSASSEGAAIALGTTVVTNSIIGDSKAVVTNSNLTAYGRNGATNGIELDNYTIGEEGTVTTSKEKKSGVVVNADAKHILRDISITGAVGVSGTFGGALDITVVMNNLDGDTKAEVIDSNINKGITSELGDVSVRAHDKIDVSSHVGTLSVGAAATGGAGLAGSGDSNILNRDTYARIVGKVNSGVRSTLNANNVGVYALGETKVHVSETGVAAAAGAEGAGAINASVSLDKFTGNTLALVSNVEGQVHKLSIDAERAGNVRTYNNAITVSGAFISGSVGVAVTDVEDYSHTNAELSNAIIKSDGNSLSVVEVLANNNTHLETELSSDSLAISIGFGVGVGVENVNMDAQVGANVYSAIIGEADKKFGIIDVKANNKLYNKFQNIDVAAASVLGVGVGKGVLNMNGQTTATMNSSSAFAKDINIWAHETRKTEDKMVGVGVGIIAVGVNLLYTNVGGNLQTSYDYDRGDGSTASYETSDIQEYVNDAIKNINDSVDTLNANTHTSGTVASTGLSSINKGSAAGKVETVIDSSALTASGTVDVKAQATTNIDSFVKQGQVAGIAAAVVASHVDVKDTLNVNIKESAVQADVIRVNSKTDGTIENYVGQGGFTVGAYADTTAYVKHHGDNTIAIDNTTLQALGAVVDKVAPLNILASNNTKIDNSGVGVNISGLTAGRLVLKGEDKTNVAINLGKNEDISGSNLLQGNGIYVEAKNAPEVKDEIKASVSVGGFEFHGSIVESHATGTASLNVTNKNSFDSGDVSLLAQTGGAQGYTTEALNHAVSVTGLDITVNKARTYSNMEATTNVGAAAFSNGLTFGNLTIGSINNTDSNAYVHTVNIGVGFACSSSLAQSHANGKAITTLDTGNSTLRVNNLDIYATNSDEIETKADGSNGGLIVVAPYAAQVENTVNTTTTTTIKGNIVAEGTVTAQALRKDLENLRADSLTVTAIGGGDVKTFSDITANTTLNLDVANISSGKDMLLEAENTVTMNRGEGFEKMVMGQGWGAVGVDTSGIVNTIKSNAHINLSNTDLVSAGDIKLLSHTMENMQVNGYIYNVSAVGGSETRVTNNITNDEQVKLTNSKIKAAGVGKNITISAADDIKLFTFAYSETGTGVVTGSNAIMHNNITRNNKIKLEGSGNQLYGMQDINLYAGKLADGNVATLDLDAEAADFSGAVIAIAVEPTVENVIKQNNQITIDAGSSSTSVRHTNLYAAQGREMARVYAGRYSGMWGSERKGSFVTTDKGQTVNGKTDQNYVKIDGNVVAGVANKLNITIGNINEVVILDDAERGIASVPEGYTKVATPTLNLDVSEGSGITASSITYGSEDYANVLLARYLQLEALITEYSKDSTPTALAGYQAEAHRIKDTMVQMGLATVDTSGKLTMQNSCRVDYVEIPDLVASGGNITIDTSDFGGSGKVAAQGTPSINIVNNTNMLLKVNEVIMDDPGGMLVYNGSALAPEGSDAAAVTASLNSKINALNKKNSGSAQAGFNKAVASEGSTGSITITGNNSLQQITYNGTIPNPIKVDEPFIFTDYKVKPLANVQIQGNIINKHGNVNITSLNNDILIQGKTAIDNVTVSGANVTLTATVGSITQGYTDGIVSIGGSVQEYYNDYYKTLPNVEKIENIGVAETLPAEGSKGSGSYIAGGSVYINAADININGVIQSGYGNYVLNIDSTVQAAITNITNAYDGSREISDAVVTAGDNYKIVDGGPVWNEAKGCYEYQLSAYYNPSTKKIIVEDVDANGGKIYLTGRISSTGAGKIVCLDGVSSIDITNQLNYTTELGQLKTNEVAGMVQITDTAGYKVGTTPVNKVTTITNGKAEVKYVDANGATVPSENDVEYVFFDSYEDVAEDLYKYNPKVGLAYQWTSGKNVSDYTRYTWHQQKALWGAWYPSASIEDLTRWEQELPYVPVTTGSIDRNKGETIVDTGLSNFTSSMTHTTNTYSSTLTKEQEKYYSTGLWGYYKHYEVTWTRSNGTTHTYNAQIKADNPIDVQFIGSSAVNAHVNVDTVANVELTGNVGNTKLYESADGSSHGLKGSINIHSQNGSLIQTGGSLYGSDIELVAGKDMQNISVTAGDTVNLSAVNAMSNQSLLGQNTIDVTVNAAYLAKGNVILGNMGSALPIKDGDGKVIGYNPLTGSTGITGIVNLNVTGSEGNISQKDGNVCIVSDRINLTSSNGAIYGQKSVDEQGNVSYTALKLYAGQQPMGLDTLDASVNASAKGDIYLEQTAGNMRIGTIYSTDGDVSLKVTNGSVEDALPYVSNDRGDADDMLARWKNLGIIAGDADAVDAKVKTDDLASYNETRFQEYLNLKALSERTEEQQVQYEAYEAEYAPYLKADGSLDAVAYNKDSQWNQYQNSVKFEFAQYQELKGKADRTEAETKQLESLTQKYGEYADFDAYLASEQVQKRKDAIYSENYGTYNTWDPYALLYAIQDSLVNPDSSALSTSDKAPNIIGHNITINVSDSVGMNSGETKRINVDTLLDKDGVNYAHLDDLKALSKLDASTKISWETGDDGYRYAVYTETIPIGIQQTTKTVVTEQGTTVVNGKLTVQSEASNPSTGTSSLNGDIFLQGREQKLSTNGESTPITQNKDLFVNNILTNIGEVTLTSLGNILNAANTGSPAITGKNLVLNAHGTIGTATNRLTTNLLGADKVIDGLSAIATDGIYVDQKGTSDLIVRNISSGGDIYLGSDQNIIMGVVNGTDAKNYIRAENNGDIVLEARGGSIGEAAYEDDGTTIKRDENNGVRILNAASKSASATDSQVTNVTLRASDSVYVTGVASDNGQSAATQGPAGWLNLTVVSTNVDAQSQTVPLNNVGIYVDGQLNLENSVSASNTASVYVTGDLKPDSDNSINISAPDTFIGGAQNVTLDGVQNIVGTNKLAIRAGQDLTMASGSLTSKDLSLNAGRNVNLNGGSLSSDASISIYAGNNLTQAGTVITAQKAAEATLAASAHLTAGNKMYLNKGSLTADNAELIAQAEQPDNTPNIVETYIDGTDDNYQMVVTNLTIDANGANLDSKNNQLQNVIVAQTSSGEIVVGNGNITNADLNVSLGGVVEASTNKLNGSLTVHNYDNNNIGVVNKIAVDKVLGATGNINLINDETDIDITSGAAITANNVLLQAENHNVNLSDGTITATADEQGTGGNVSLKANNVVMAKPVGAESSVAGPVVTAVNANITAGDSINLADGSLIANKATLQASTGAITEANTGFVVDVADVTATANGVITLNSTANQLEKVKVANTAGNVAIGSGNNQNTNALAVSTNSNGQVNGNLTIINYADGSENKNTIAFGDNLKATGNITITNQEAAISVNDKASIVGDSVTITAAVTNETSETRYDVNINGGSIKANNAIDIKGKDIATTGTINGQSITMDASNNAIVSDGTISGAVVTIGADTKATMSGGIITATKADGTGKLIVNYNRNSAFEQNGSIIIADTADINATNATMSGGSISADNLDLDAQNVSISGGNILGGVVDIDATSATTGSTVDGNITINGGSMAGNVIDINASRDVTISDGNIHVEAVSNQDNTGKTAIAAGNDMLIGGGKLTGKEITFQANNITMNGGRVGDFDSAASNAMITLHATNNLLINNGTLLNTNSGDAIQLQGAAVTVNGGEVGTKTVNVNATNDIALNGGLVHADEVGLTSTQGTIKQQYDNTAAQNGGLVYAGDLYIIANKNIGDALTVDLGSRYNHLKNVFIDYGTKGNILIGSGNIITGDLNVSVLSSSATEGQVPTLGQLDGSLTVHNFRSGAANKLVVSDNLQATGNITLINDEANIEIADDGTGTAANLQAKNIILDTNYDIVHRSCTVQALASNSSEASGKIDLDADGSILLLGGSMSAKNVDMLAVDHIYEQYNNADGASAASSYALAVSDTLDILTTGGSTVDYGIDLGSRFNQLHKVEMNSDNGNVVLGNGGSANLEVSVQTIAGTAQTVQGNILIHNYKNNNDTTNDVKIINSLKATKEIVIINDNGDIINSGTTLSGSNITLNAFAGDVFNFAGITATNGGVDIYAANNVYNIGDAEEDAITATGTVSIVAGSVTHGTDEGLVWNTARIHSDANVVIQATDGVVNLVNGDSLAKPGDVSEATSNQNGAISANGTVQITTIHKSDSTATEPLGIYNSASITAGENAIINSRNSLTNTGDIIVNGYIDLDATEEVINGVAPNATGQSNPINQIKAGGDVYLTSWKGNVNNYDNIESTNGRVVLENGFVYTLDDNNNRDLVNNIVNTGSILAKDDVTIRTYNGSINNENVITSQTGSVTIEALRSEHYQPTIGSTAVVGVIRNTGTNDATNNADIMAAQNITMNAAASIINIGDFIVNEGNIQVNANDTILNLGNYSIEDAGNISVISNNGDVLNIGKYYTESGNIHMEAHDDLINLGVMETEAGNINLSSLNGSLHNEAGADLLTGDGNITLAAKSATAELYYSVIDANNNIVDTFVDPQDSRLHSYSDGDKKGSMYYQDDSGVIHDVIKNGSVFNAGDAMAINGTITMTSAHGDVTNYDDFNTLSTDDAHVFSKEYNGISIATGNVAIIAEKGTLYNTKDLESGENITLTAANGLTNFAYNVYAGKDITLTATSGNVENISVLESIYGDVTLIAQNGSVINGRESASASGDIITLGGTVKLQATGDVKNYGDIIAIGKTMGDVAGSGSIVLKSEQGSVYNYDDFNTLHDGSTINYAYGAGKHISVAGRPAAGTSYNIATSNITLSAVNGTIFNDKDYLVALGDVTLEAQHGIGSYGDVILAGGNITMSDTDGDLINQANLVSLSGDITLNASKGTVVNMTRGEVVALDGNVVLNAGGPIDADHRIYLIDDFGNKTTLNTTGVDAGDRIIITENYYLNDNNEKVFLTNTLLNAPSGKRVYTQVSFINDNEERVLIKDGIAGRQEAFRAGDVVNRGDIVAQNIGSKDLSQAGNVQLNSAHGNVANYDDYKLVDAQKDSANRGFYDYLGENGYRTDAGLVVKFNANLGNAYNANKRYILSDSGMELKAPEGYLYNDLALKSHHDITLESGKTLTVGTNFASVEADGDVVIRSTQGNVYNNSSVVSNTGSIVLDGFNGVESQVGAENLQALNGSISAVSIYGDVNIDELIAGEMAAAGSQQGNVVVGSLEGKDVVLYTESADATISVGKGIKVDEYLLLQGNYLDLPTIQRTNTDGTLLVDVNGVGAAGGSAAMKSDLNLTIDGDVRFTTMNVTNADVEIGGKLSIDKLHVAGAGHFTSFDFVTGVYGGGSAPKHDSSNALYCDLGDGTGSGYNMRVSAEEFRAIKEGTPETVRALATMKSLKERLALVAATPGTFNTDNSGWMNLYVDKSNYQRSNGLLLHIDTGYRSANQRWSAEDLSTKLVDFIAHEAFTTNYGDVAGTFGRYDLVESSAKPMGEILHTANENKVVLQKDNSSLRIEEKQEEKE